MIQTLEKLSTELDEPLTPEERQQLFWRLQPLVELCTEIEKIKSNATIRPETELLIRNAELALDRLLDHLDQLNLL